MAFTRKTGAKLAMCSRAAEYPWVSPVARPRIDCSPEPPRSEAFNPDYLRQHLRPLAAAEADAAVLAYQAYYGLDLRSRHPRLQARLGSMAVDGRRLAVQAWLLPEARGSLLLMQGATQDNWRHGIDKLRRPCGPRLNLTFRQVFPRS